MKRLIFILAALFATAQSQTIQTIGAPTTTVVSRGNFRTDSIFYLPKRQKLPTDSGAVRYQISDSSVYYWSGFQWLKLGVNIDTASMLNPYVRGSGTANYLPKFNASRSIVDSKVYEVNTNLLFNTTTPYFTTSGIGSFDINGSTASVLVLRKADTARGYWSHNGATMDINNLSAGDIRFYTNAQLRGRFQTDGTFRLNSLTGTGTRSVVADANGVLSASSTPTDLIDTTYISTRAWRQKGDDSLGAIIATKGSGTVTSVATGYGLSGGTITTTGTIIVDTALIASRLRVGKVVDSLALVKQNVLTNPVTGTGTTNYVPKFTGTSTIGNSIIFDDGTNVGIGTITPGFKLDVSADARINSVNFGRGGGSISTNTAIGTSSIVNNTTGSNNTAVGSFALNQNTTGQRNSAFGSNALRAATTGTLNTAMGNDALRTMTTANSNIALGYSALYSNNGDENIGIGLNALYSNSSGIRNIAIGADAGRGANENTTGSNNIFIGYGIGGVSATESNRTFIGNSSTVSTWLGGELLLATTTDAGDYKLQVSGNAYVTGTTVLAATSGNVGVGTASPSAKADIVGTMRVASASFVGPTSGAGMEFSFRSSDSTGYIATYSRDYSAYRNQAYFALSHKFAYGTGGSTGLFVTSSGETLLNTETDAGDYKLQVSGNIYGSAQAVFADALQARSAVFTGNFNDVPIGWFDQNNTTSDRSFGLLIDAGTTSGDYALRIRNAAASSDMFHVRGNGNVGVGLAAPLNKFTVSTASDETVSLTDLSGYASLVYRHRTTNAYRDGLIDGGNVYINSESNGELRINTKTDAGDYKLQVSGNAYVYNASAGSAVVTMMGGARAGPLGLKIFNETIAQSTIIALGEESGTSSTPFFIRRYGSGNANASAVEIVNGQNAAMWLSTNSTERIRLHANGGLKFVGQSAAPTAEAGTVYYDTDDNKLKVYNGTTWVDLH